MSRLGLDDFSEAAIKASCDHDLGPPSLNAHARMSTAKIIATYSTPDLRRGELTPAQYRAARIGNRTWSESDEAAWVASQ